MRALCVYTVCAVMLLMSAVQAMSLFGEARPTDLTFTDASHPSTPIMIDGLEVNGRSMGNFPTLASTSWMNPRGGNTTLTSMPWNSDDDAFVDIEAAWTEIATGRSYSAELSVAWTDLKTETVISPTAYMTFVYGRHGEFLLFTDAEPDPKTGQYNGREVTRVCGKRTPNRDQNYGLRINEIPGLGRLIERRDQWMAMPKVETTCTMEGA